MTATSRILVSFLMITGSATARAQVGTGLISGVVSDSAGKPLEGVEVRLPELKRRVHTSSSGAYRFEGVERGTWLLAVRRIGFLPESRRVVLDSGPVEVGFRLVPTAAVLPALVSDASRLGLSGRVLDTAGNPVAGARVRVLAAGRAAETDSTGTFWVAVPRGSYMVAVDKEQFAQRLAGVTIPADSGRYIDVWLRPAVTIPVRQAWNVEDMRERLAFVKPSQRFVYTREMLEKEGITEVFDAVHRMGSRFNLPFPVNPDCLVVIDGGPALDRLGDLHTRQVEFVEVYARFSNNTATSRGSRFNQRSNTDDATRANRLIKSCLGVYVWLR